MIKLKYQTVFNEVDELKEFRQPIYDLHNLLHGIPTSDDELKKDIGWVDLPADETENKKIMDKIVKTRRRLKKLKIDVLVVVGVGGSMLGTKAIYDIVRPSYSRLHEDQIEIVFLGHTLNERHIQGVLKYIKNRNFAINVVSKSGSTLEIKVSFNLLLDLLKTKYKTKREIWRRVIITSSVESSLYELALSNKSEFYEIPSDIGGRFSTLTAVGLVPLGIADINIKELLEGAYEAYEELIYPIPQNPAYLYACSRASLYSRHHKMVELGIVFEPSMEYFIRWWRMVFAESEGKDGWGLFPGLALFTSELHSLGQWIQEGDSDPIFESFHIIRQEGELKLNMENLLEDEKFLGERTIADMEYAVLRGTLQAHRNRMSYLDDKYIEKSQNPVPHIVFEWEDYDEKTIGYAFYFFQKAAAMYCLLIGVNPFDQPGVDAYKKAALEYIVKGEMYLKDEDVVLEYKPPAVDLLKQTDEEALEKEMIEEERMKDIDDDAIVDFDDLDEDEEYPLDEEYLDESDMEDEGQILREEVVGSRVIIDKITGRERVGIEEVGEIRITIKPNRTIEMPTPVVSRPTRKRRKTPSINRTATIKVAKRTKKKTTSRKTTPKKIVTKKTTSRKTTKKVTPKKTASSRSTQKKIAIKAKGKSSNKRAFTKLKV